jgi:hypothetical protein
MDYIKPTEETWDLISYVLLSFGIKNEICENRDGIKVDRDSIISNTIPSDRTEQGHYDRLMVKLKNNFPSSRLAYTAKTDDWLLLQVIS